MNNNFFDSIKITEEDKKKAMMNILQIVSNSVYLLSLKEVIQYDNTLTSRLTEDEILAMYSLAREVKISRLASKQNEELYQYLNDEKILEFIKVAVEDMQDTRKTPNAKWSLSVNKILSRLESKGKDSSGEVLIMKKSEKKNEDSNIIDISEYLDK